MSIAAVSRNFSTRDSCWVAVAGLILTGWLSNGLSVPDWQGILQQAYLKASNTESEDTFGSSVAMSGDIIVVRAPFEMSSATGVNGNQTNNGAIESGAAYVFARVGTN